MNLWQALLLPWQIIQRGMRWLVLVLLAAVAICMAVFALVSGKPDMWVRTAGIIGLAEAMVWMACMTNTVLLTIDAQQLRVPGITRHAVLGVLLNGILGVLLPTLVIGLFGGHAAAIAALVALMSVAGFLYSLLSRAVGYVLYISFFITLTNDSLRQGPTRPDFLMWTLPLLFLGLVLIAFCWRRLVRMPNPYRVSWSTPSALRVGRVLSAAAAGRGSTSKIHSRPDWLQARPDLHRCGPGHPVLSLRMALGGPGTPLTFMGWLRQSAVAVSMIVALAVWLLVLLLHDHSGPAQGKFWNAGVLVLLAFASFIGVISAITSSTYLMARWRLVNAELPLLALLPQLGNDVKRDLLKAALWPAMRVLLLAAVLVLLAVSRVQQHATAVFAVLVLVTAAAHATAFALHTLGGGRRWSWECGAAGIVGIILCLGGLVAVMLSSDPANASARLDDFWNLLLLGWLIQVVLLFRVGWRGWRALQRRPHPFLTH